MVAEFTLPGIALYGLGSRLKTATRIKGWFRRSKSTQKDEQNLQKHEENKDLRLQAAIHEDATRRKRERLLIRMEEVNRMDPGDARDQERVKVEEAYNDLMKEMARAKDSVA